jgi:ankyrin repeat protein
MLETSGNSQPLTAVEVLRRYKDEELPEFCEIPPHDVNRAGNFGDRPIHVASNPGSLDEIAALVHGGADVDATGERGDTPLHHAVAQGHVAVVEALLEYGASRSQRNNLAMTALDPAKLNGRNDIAKLLGKDRD